MLYIIIINIVTESRQAVLAIKNVLSRQQFVFTPSLSIFLVEMFLFVGRMDACIKLPKILLENWLLLFSNMKQAILLECERHHTTILYMFSTSAKNIQ